MGIDARTFDDHVFVVQQCQYPDDPEAFERFREAFASPEGAWIEECPSFPDCPVVFCAGTQREALGMLAAHIVGCAACRRPVPDPIPARAARWDDGRHE